MITLTGGSPKFRLTETSYNSTDMYMSNGKFLLNNLTDGGDLEIRTKNFDNAIFIDDSTQQIGIGDYSPSYKLDVNGTIGATGDVIAYHTSDIRLKKNIIKIDDAVSNILQLNGMTFE